MFSGTPAAYPHSLRSLRYSSANFFMGASDSQSYSNHIAATVFGADSFTCDRPPGCDVLPWAAAKRKEGAADCKCRPGHCLKIEPSGRRFKPRF